MAGMAPEGWHGARGVMLSWGRGRAAAGGARTLAAPRCMPASNGTMPAGHGTMPASTMPASHGTRVAAPLVPAGAVRGGGGGGGRGAARAARGARHRRGATHKGSLRAPAGARLLLGRFGLLGSPGWQWPRARRAALRCHAASEGHAGAGAAAPAPSLAIAASPRLAPLCVASTQRLIRPPCSRPLPASTPQVRCQKKDVHNMFKEPVTEAIVRLLNADCCWAAREAAVPGIWRSEEGRGGAGRGCAGSSACSKGWPPRPS